MKLKNSYLIIQQLYGQHISSESKVWTFESDTFWKNLK